ncbi:MAG: ATP-binding protein, partial [Vicinamibacterales bacterium]
MSHEEIYQRLREHLAFLRMQSAAELLASALDDAGKNKHSYTVFLERLLAAEVDAARERTLRGLQRFAHLPVERRLDEFDFDAQPRLD